VQDIAALIALEVRADQPLACVVAHDWGGAVAWNLANQQSGCMRRLAIINSPHPGTFLRELRDNPRQQQASAYMNFLIRPDAERLLAQNDYERLWGFFRGWGSADWLTDSVRQQYRDVWDGPDGGPPGAGLVGGCNYYRASPLRPPRDGDPAAAAVTLRPEKLRVELPTLVLWGMQDVALPPELVDGLEEYVPHLQLEKVENASHWIVHEQPRLVAERLGAFLAQ
jgi:pimeloyl-ACP methyl ester carboxylesterase